MKTIENEHTHLGLTDEDVLEMYEKMLLARKIDERMWLLNRSGKIPFVVSCQGQEATQVGAAFALDKDVDYIAPYYRDLGVVLSFGLTARDIMLSGFAKAEDPNSGGRQMPGHFGSKKHRIITGSSPVTTQVPHAVGFALAAKIKKERFVTFTTLGEGSTNQGDFHEGLNFAGVHKLPIVTLVQNNKFAISVPYDKQVASETVAIRASSYGMHGEKVDGTDPLKVFKVIKEARERALKGEPSLIEAETVRLTAHSSDDNDAVYRTKEEKETDRKNDCILKFQEYLKSCEILTDEIEASITEKIQTEVNEATKYAENAPFAPIDSIANFVYEQ